MIYAYHLWLGGNDDIHTRRSRPAALEVARVVPEVDVVGPTPRTARDAPDGPRPEWEETAAWHLFDRAVAAWARERRLSSQDDPVSSFPAGESACAVVQYRHLQ